MTRVFSLWFLVVFVSFAGAQQEVFQGRIEFGKDLAAFEKSPPVPGALYLLTGAAANVRIVSQNPFMAEVDFVEGEWKSEAELVGHRALLRFAGAGWAKMVAAKRPREGADSVIYPYRKFQVAAVADRDGFRVLAVPVFF